VRRRKILAGLSFLSFCLFGLIVVNGDAFPEYGNTILWIAVPLLGFIGFQYLDTLSNVIRRVPRKSGKTRLVLLLVFFGFVASWIIPFVVSLNDDAHST
jgi:hypothetical protein